MSFSVAFISIGLIWCGLIFVLTKLSYWRRLEEMDFPATEWPEFKKNPVEQRVSTNQSNVLNQQQGSTQ